MKKYEKNLKAHILNMSRLIKLKFDIDDIPHAPQGMFYACPDALVVLGCTTHYRVF